MNLIGPGFGDRQFAWCALEALLPWFSALSRGTRFAGRTRGSRLSRCSRFSGKASRSRFTRKTIQAFFTTSAGSPVLDVRNQGCKLQFSLGNPAIEIRHSRRDPEIGFALDPSGNDAELLGQQFKRRVDV